MTATSYVILASNIGEEMANYFIDNHSSLYRVLFPKIFAMGNPMELLQAMKFGLSLTFNALGLGIAIYTWETNHKA
jgi:hypothetical protein